MALGSRIFLFLDFVSRPRRVELHLLSFRACDFGGEYAFPAIPKVNQPREANRAYRLDFGPESGSGILSVQPPLRRGGEEWDEAMK